MSDKEDLNEEIMDMIEDLESGLEKRGLRELALLLSETRLRWGLKPKDRVQQVIEIVDGVFVQPYYFIKRIEEMLKESKTIQSNKEGSKISGIEFSDGEDSEKKTSLKSIAENIIKAKEPAMVLIDQLTKRYGLPSPRRSGKKGDD